MNVMDFSRGSGINYESARAMYQGRVNRYDADILSRTCAFLGVQVGDLLVYVPDEEKGA